MAKMWETELYCLHISEPPIKLCKVCRMESFLCALWSGRIGQRKLLRKFRGYVYVVHGASRDVTLLTLHIL